MHLAEVPLLIFTILGQMSAGAFIVLGAVRLLAAGRWGAERMERLSDVALYAIGPTLVLGFAGSFLHLGNPMNAANAMNHLGSSGMSREILAGVLFALVGAAYTLCQFKRWGSSLLRHVLAAVTALLGLALVWMMASLYLLPTVPTWNTWTTPASFFATTILLGAIAVAAALAARVRFPQIATANRDDERIVVTVLGPLVGLALACVGVLVLLEVVHVAMLSGETSAAAAHSLAVITSGGGLWLALRIGLSLLGALGLGVYLFTLRKRDDSGVARTLFLVVLAAFVLVFLGEVVGRELFYASYARLGV